MRAIVPLCLPCAAKLRAIKETRGEQAMVKAMGRTLCEDCRALVNLAGGMPLNTPLTFIKV